MTIGVTGLALGLGARYPRFKIDNAAKIATGFGGVLYMMFGVLTLILVISLSGLPTMTLVRWSEHGSLPGTGRLVSAVLAGLGTVLIPLVAGVLAVRSGARRLEERASEPRPVV